MIFHDRMEFIDQCIAGEKTQFNLLLSENIFGAVERGYELYRDYIKRKQSVSNINCTVTNNDVIFHITSTEKPESLISDNFPKKGIQLCSTDDGVDLHIILIESLDEKGDENS